MGEKHQDKSTIAFSRINIDYRGKKPNVKFSFPGDPTKCKPSSWAYSFIIALIIYALLFLIISFSIAGYQEFILSEEAPYYYKYSSCMDYQEARQEWICREHAENDTPLSYLNDFGLYSPGIIPKKEKIKQTLFHFLPITFLTILIYLLFGKRLKEDAPKIEAGKNAFTSGVDHYRKIFKPKDVENNSVEIPLFKNIKLDYNATKEFSKYLEEVKITEHPFQAIEYKTFAFRKKKKKKVLPNEYLWRARFYFSQKPKTGKLEVKWK